MTKADKLRRKILSGSVKNVRFEELCTFLEQNAFEPQQNATSHRIYRRNGVRELINVQPQKGGEAKPIQVKQVRKLFEVYNL